jgi:hypothetical protein
MSGLVLSAAVVVGCGGSGSVDGAPDAPRAAFGDLTVLQGPVISSASRSVVPLVLADGTPVVVTADGGRVSLLRPDGGQLVESTGVDLDGTVVAVEASRDGDGAVAAVQTCVEVRPPSEDIQEPCASGPAVRLVEFPDTGAPAVVSDVAGSAVVDVGVSAAGVVLRTVDDAGREVWSIRRPSAGWEELPAAPPFTCATDTEMVGRSVSMEMTTTTGVPGAPADTGEVQVLDLAAPSAGWRSVPVAGRVSGHACAPAGTVIVANATGGTPAGVWWLGPGDGAPVAVDPPPGLNGTRSSQLSSGQWAQLDTFVDGKATTVFMDPATGRWVPARGLKGAGVAPFVTAVDDGRVVAFGPAPSTGGWEYRPIGR